MKWNKGLWIQPSNNPAIAGPSLLNISMLDTTLPLLRSLSTSALRQTSSLNHPLLPLIGQSGCEQLLFITFDWTKWMPATPSIYEPYSSSAKPWVLILAKSKSKMPLAQTPEDLKHTGSFLHDPEDVRVLVTAVFTHQWQMIIRHNQQSLSTCSPLPNVAFLRPLHLVALSFKFHIQCLPFHFFTEF